MIVRADLHTHTVASTHAFSTMDEMIRMAMKLGYGALAVTDHAPAMPDAPHRWYFNNLTRQPDMIDDYFLFLKGVEANVVNHDGTLDLDPVKMAALDWVIASLHASCIETPDYGQATNLWLRVAENPLVDMIGHSEQACYLYDYDRVTKAFAANHKVVEMNANSAISRPGNEHNLRKLAFFCMKNGTKIAVNSDAHSIYEMNNQAHILAMLQEIKFPENHIINTSTELLIQELALHGKDIVKRIAGHLPLPAAGQPEQESK